MVAVFWAVIRRDALLAFRRRSDVLATVFFFIMVVSLFPLGVGPERDLLRTMAPGVLWVAALLASMLSLGRLFAFDFADGTLEQMLLSPEPLSVIVAAKVLAHWLVSGLPLVVLAPLLALQFDLPGDAVGVLVSSLLLGTPVLSLVGAIGAALTLGLRGGGVLVALLVLPLCIPVLIFGAGAVSARPVDWAARPICICWQGSCGCQRAGALGRCGSPARVCGLRNKQSVCCLAIRRAPEGLPPGGTPGALVPGGGPGADPGWFVCGLFCGPNRPSAGEAYRIIFVHVPAAWLSMLIYLVMAFWAVIGWVFNTRLSSMMARALAPTGALFTFLALWTGALWGKPTWGTWWVWDARLTSELILLFLYIGFMALQAAIDDPRRGDKAGALLALVGVVNVPVIYFSVKWWNTLHQGASISFKAAPTMATTMLVGMLLCAVGLWAYAIGVSLLRLRSLVLERERGAEWVTRLPEVQRQESRS